jgi:ribonucleoside-diphosphate reductase alpha chain
MSAIEQLELWLVYQQNWCEHNPSITVTVKENEWLDVGAWVYNNFDNACGLTFLPATDHIYRQAPYQECNKKTYTEMVKKMPTEIDWSELSKYENTDTTEGSQELACTSGQCLI